MKEWLKANLKTISWIALVSGAYALSKFPGLEAEHDLIVAIGWIAGAYGTGFVPGFARSKDEK